MKKTIAVILILTVLFSLAAAQLALGVGSPPSAPTSGTVGGGANAEVPTTAGVVLKNNLKHEWVYDTSDTTTPANTTRTLKLTEANGTDQMQYVDSSGTSHNVRLELETPFEGDPSNADDVDDDVFDSIVYILTKRNGRSQYVPCIPVNERVRVIPVGIDNDYKFDALFVPLEHLFIGEDEKAGVLAARGGEAVNQDIKEQLEAEPEKETETEDDPETQPDKEADKDGEKETKKEAKAPNPEQLEQYRDDAYEMLISELPENTGRPVQVVISYTLDGDVLEVRSVALAGDTGSPGTLPVILLSLAALAALALCGVVIYGGSAGGKNRR